MNSATQPPPRSDGAADEAAADHRLQRVLRELPPCPGDAARVEALQQRVLAQWQAAHAPAVGSRVDGGALRRLVLAGPGRRRWLLGSGLLLGGAAIVLGLWLHQTDPVLDELLQPDVLSQMAIGQM